MAQKRIRLTKREATGDAPKAGGNGSDSGAIRITFADDDGDERAPEFEPVRTVASADAGTSADSDASSEAEERSASAVDPSSFTPRKGRHRNGCDCARCTERRAKQGTRASARKTTIPTANFEKLMVGLHLGIAALLKAPEFKLDDDGDEAKVLSEAFFKMADAWGWNIGAVSPKTEATVNAAIAVSIVYGPKIKAYAVRTKTAKPRPMAVMSKPNGAAPHESPRPVVEEVKPNPFEMN